MADVLTSLAALENRLKCIENKVHGNSSTEYDNNRKVVDVVFEAQKRLKDAEAKKSTLGMIFKQLATLDEYLSGEFFQRINSTSDANCDLILSAKEQMKESVKKLEEITSLKDVLDKNNLTDVPEWNRNLEPLILVQMQQNGEAEDLNTRVTELLSAYNNIISFISKQFVQWENVITQCEIAFGTARAEDEM